MPPEADQPQGLPDNAHLMGHTLKSALAGAWHAAERLVPHLPRGNSAEDEFAELRRALADADQVAEALLGRRAMPSVERPPLDVDWLVSQMESSLRRILDPSVTLSVRLSAGGAEVLAERDEIEGIVERLVESAGLAMGEGGDLTLSTGWLDQIANDWPHQTFACHRYVRLSVADTGQGDYADTRQRVVSDPTTPGSTTPGTESLAALVDRLGGHIIVECAPDEGSRIHVCLPAAGSTPAWPTDAA